MLIIHGPHLSILEGESERDLRIQITGVLQHPVLSIAVGLHGVHLRTMQPCLFIATFIHINTLNT